MKFRMTLSLALAMSLLLTLTSLPAAAQGQRPRLRPIADTGVMSLGPNQVLRITVVRFLGQEDFSLQTSFSRMGYEAVVATGDVRPMELASQNTTAPMTLGPGEAASLEMDSYFGGGDFDGVRVIVLSSSRNVQVHASIVDTTTGNITAIVPTIVIG